MTVSLTYVKDLKAGKPAHGGKPKDLKVAVRPEKDLEVSWQPDASVSVFQLEVKYFKKGALGLQEPSHHKSLEVKGSTCLAHPEDLDKGQPWTVIVNLTAMCADGSVSEAAQCQVAWDDQQSAEATLRDLQQRCDDLEKMLAPFLVQKGKCEILVVGPQHHGKSSHGNHLDRVLNVDLNRFDRFDQAPAGADERTMATKYLKVAISSSEMTFIDFPAFSAMNDQTTRQLTSALSGHIPEGTRREQLWQISTLFGKPAEAAIVTVSLIHWRDQLHEMQLYLQKMAEVFKNASWGTVEFPYVVVATHRDEFLKQCQGEDPMKALTKAKNGIKKWALTDHVYAITNYKRGSMGSAANNQETFEMLAQLLTKAARQETSVNCLACFQGFLRL